MVNKTKKNYCKDCGGAQVNHRLMYASVFLGSIVEPWTNWMGRIIPETSFDFLGAPMTKALTFLHLGRITYKPEENDSGRTRVLWEEAIKRGIDMYEFRLFGIGHDVFVSNYKGEKRFFDILPRPKNYNPRGLEWMDIKNEMKKHFQKAGIKVADGDVTCSLKKGLEIFRRLQKPVITKPNIGSRSRHTTTHIMTEEEFIVAFKKARQLSPRVMIEEELSGYVFRGVVIGEKFIACIRREPEDVIGDGIHTIRELVDIENRNPLRQGPIFHHLCTGKDEENELHFWHHTWDTIPAKDEVVTLGQKTSRAVGGGITDVTDEIHPDNIELLEKIGKVLDDPLIGVDFIMEDISKSWRDQPRCGVIECNSAPFIDLHHFPLVGKPRNVAGALWDIIYPESKPKA
jgi:D-alanine-D-alanine ligase-like ATP-grasp enzyme